MSISWMRGRQWVYRHPTTGNVLLLTESLEERRALFRALGTLSMKWMNSASALAPLSIQSIVHVRNNPCPGVCYVNEGR